MGFGSRLWGEVMESGGGKSQKLKQVGWHFIENILDRELAGLKIYRMFVEFYITRIF